MLEALFDESDDARRRGRRPSALNDPIGIDEDERRRRNTIGVIELHGGHAVERADPDKRSRGDGDAIPRRQVIGDRFELREHTPTRSASSLDEQDYLPLSRGLAVGGVGKETADIKHARRPFLRVLRLSGRDGVNVCAEVIADGALENPQLASLHHHGVRQQDDDERNWEEDERAHGSTID
jgi:hypothetical protein